MLNAGRPRWKTNRSKRHFLCHESHGWRLAAIGSIDVPGERMTRNMAYLVCVMVQFGRSTAQNACDCRDGKFCMKQNLVSERLPAAVAPPETRVLFSF